MSVERPTFPVVRWREAYDAEQVDLAVEMVMENLSLPEPRIGRHDLESLRFTPVRRGGYDMTAVDDWLDEVVAELDRRGGVRPEAAESTPGREPTSATVAPGVITDLDATAPERDSERVRVVVMVALVVVLAVLFYVTFA
ncbi:hypothetical protein ASG76_01350 [Nocardioides sp. Soil774]|uniref:DivIVA domain-containing protein n=1 Tax=Nocardioides sp. Soil774 TaxID=1736408 RepID=UPI0006F378DA|nr:DivIVA domain-containing protein [Nocardioides sp. Soil774]KRE97398.1 hypothetical protein ASG76_01350 [Nocardioides sp. Soil774]